jgi:hypothetical protein
LKPEEIDALCRVLGAQPRRISLADLPVLNRTAAATDDFLGRMRSDQGDVLDSWWQDQDGTLAWPDRRNIDKIYQLGAGDFEAGTSLLFGGLDEEGLDLLFINSP